MNAREAFDITTLLRKEIATANRKCRANVLADPSFAIDCFTRLISKEPLADMTPTLQAAVSCCAITKLLELLTELPREKAAEILARDN